ncbi:MAG: TonB-dependent receptor, partial [Flavobacteriales bacterium]|nr:TonB-dependent receptor [Flavobacteriales bacterium]
MHWRSLFYGFLGGGFPFWGKVFLLAQPATQDSLRLLKPVTVEAPRLMDFRAGQKEQVWDSAALAPYGQRNLADLLGAESSVFIKAYGPGLLASPTLRGGSAQHMAVVWQGIPINSPMNGQSDLALIPVEAGDVLRLQYGGSSGLWGSGAVAGTVHLNSRPLFDKAFDMGLRMMAGSFGDYRQKAHMAWSNGHYWISAKAFHGFARNDFPFLNTNFFPPEKQRLPHAAWHNMGLICDGAVRLRRHQQMTLHVWMQKTLRNLPPTLLEAFSEARQQDYVGRALANWSTEKNRLHLGGRLAFLADRLVYSDPSSGIHNTSLSRQIVMEAEARYRIGENHLLYGGLHNTLAFGRHDNYGGWRHQNRWAVLAGYTWSHFSGKIQCALGLRQEILNLQWAPLTGSVGFTFAPWRWLEVKALGNRVYRAPTLNDLYWRPGGNPQLQPEHGFSAEGGLKLKTSWKAWRLLTEVTYFSRLIKNWIIWLPAGAFWTPQNLMQVWSRGTETFSCIEWHR